MSAASARIIELTEYVPARFPRNEIPDGVGDTLWRTFGHQVAVDFPSPKTDGQWQFTAQGWVGYIPVFQEFGFALRPKIPLSNLFRMLEYAFRLKSLRFLDGLIDCQSLQEFYERLANVLARRILDRGRRGFYRAYVPETERLPYIRGRVDVRQLVSASWSTSLTCTYHDHTADIEENQILAWTLFVITHSGTCTERVLPTVRQAYRALQGLVTLQPYSPRACCGRVYNRLNEDYQPLHALSRFFLEHSGPSHETGDHAMLPFLVDMEHLYELFVAEWLTVHLPRDTRLKAQERVVIDNDATLHFDIDLVLYDATTGRTRFILDTKYKTPVAPSTDDISKTVAYAESKDCREAILVYPTALSRSSHVQVGGIRVRSLTFALDGDLDRAGQAFMQGLYQPDRNPDELQYTFPVSSR